MRHQIRSLHPETHGRVVDVVDEVVHGWRGQIHESMDLRLAGGAGVGGEGGGGAAEDYADVVVEVREEGVLVGGRVPGCDVGPEGGDGAAVEEVDRGGVLGGWGVRMDCVLF